LTSPDLSKELEWDVKLFWRRGGRVRLAGIRVYYEFKWRDLMPNRRMQFRNGQCLAERVRVDCPEGKIPALLLTARDGIEEGARVTSSFYVVVLNLPRYLEQAEANAAVSYLAKALGPITQARKLQELAAADPKELRTFIQLSLESTDIADWARGDEERLEQVRSIAAQGDPLGAAVDALRSLSGLDADIVEAVAELARTETDREKRLELLRAVTEDATGRFVAGEVLGERIEDRLADARSAAAEYMGLVEDEGTTETDLQRFLEANPWLLGLDYSHVLARQQILRGTVDFLLARFDGFYDLIELKSPSDPIISAPSERALAPSSASRFSLSPSLAQALAQVHVYRDALANEQVASDWFGLPDSRDPRVVIVIGNTAKLGKASGRVLREVNRSMHRLEIVPYDVLGNRAKAVLDSVSRHLVAADETGFASAGAG
jgi:hypothetical protein